MTPLLSGLWAAFAALFIALSPAAALELRTESFVVSEWSGPPVRVFYVEPDPEQMDAAPVVLVLHGVDRNADDYARNWEDLAREHGLRIYAPEFSARSFPGAALYNLGGFGTNGPFAFEALEAVFAAARERGGRAEGYHLFGHSAGAQAVHRAVLLEPLPHLITAYAANAGWYTLPHAGFDWPYGLNGAGVDDQAVRAWLGAPLVVLLGDQDTDPNHQHLRRTPEADAQGPHRYARGANFIAVGRARAASLDTPFAWRAASVPGIAHDNAGMARAAAALIAEHPDGFTAAD